MLYFFCFCFCFIICRHLFNICYFTRLLSFDRYNWLGHFIKKLFPIDQYSNTHLGVLRVLMSGRAKALSAKGFRVLMEFSIVLQWTYSTNIIKFNTTTSELYKILLSIDFCVTKLLFICWNSTFSESATISEITIINHLYKLWKKKI